MILLVEDNDKLAQVYCQSLNLHGFKAECCFSGEDGLKFLDNHEPELIIVDLALPDMDGVTFTVQARAAGYDGPVLAMSGAAVLMNEEQLAPGRFVDTLQKPLRLADLLQSVAKALVQR